MFYKELKGDALEAYNKMVQVLRAKAVKELNLPETEIVVRPIRPEDIGHANPTWTWIGTTANAWADILPNKTISDNRYVGISGAYNAEGAGELDQIKITRKGSVSRYWDMRPLRWQSGRKTAIYYCDDPITIDQNTTITVSAYCTAASSLVEFAFIGAVAEKKGLLISP